MAGIKKISALQKKTLKFSDVFRGQRKGALGTNGLINKDGTVQLEPREDANILKSLLQTGYQPSEKNCPFHVINLIEVPLPVYYNIPVYSTTKETNFCYPTYPKMLLNKYGLF